MNRRTFAVATATTPILSGCLYDDFFDLKWEEEIQLQDGRVIVVSLKHTFQRLKQGFSRYGGSIARRDTEMAFDGGLGIGKVIQLFKNFHPIFLDQDSGSWYSVIYGKYYINYRLRTGQYWGEHETEGGQLALKLISGKWQPISLRQLPDHFLFANIFTLGGKAPDWAKLANRRVTVAEKIELSKTLPPDQGLHSLQRPRFVAPRANHSSQLSKEAQK